MIAKRIKGRKQKTSIPSDRAHNKKKPGWRENQRLHKEPLFLAFPSVSLNETNKPQPPETTQLKSLASWFTSSLVSSIPLYKFDNIFLLHFIFMLINQKEKNQYLYRSRTLTIVFSMASLVLLFSELVRNHDQWDAAVLLAAYPSSCSAMTSSGASAAGKPVIDQSSMQNSQITEEKVMDNPLESRVCLDFVWPWLVSCIVS